MADSRKVSIQEQILLEAQKKLERIEKMREQMARQVELEVQRLNELRDAHEEFIQSGGEKPSLSQAAPSSFQSQFDQFKTTDSNKRLTPIGSKGAVDLSGILQPIKNDEPYYRASDRDEHWASLSEDPGKPVFVSGRYVSTEHGSYTISSMKEYEYELSTRALPVSVGDTMRVPVHPTGHGDGRAYSTGHLQIMITDIYSKEKFQPYHDRIEG